ncbi:MAG: NTPase [Candidatus Methanomethylicaceae archaeon]
MTGRPGIGKSTVLKEVIKILQGNGWRVGGILCPEVRINGRRVAFEIVDLLTGERGVLASVNEPSEVVVGRYYVNMRDLDKISLSAIRRLTVEADLTAIDEVGPMEMKSKAFRNLVNEAFTSDKKVIAVIHWALLKNFAPKFPNLRIFEITEHNRNSAANEIVKYLLGGSY